MIPDHGNVFPRLRIAMEMFCCYPDNLRQRLRAVHGQIYLLLDDDFPDHMRAEYHKLNEELPKSETPRFRDKRRGEIAKLFLVLYTKAAQLG